MKKIILHIKRNLVKTIVLIMVFFSIISLVLLTNSLEKSGDHLKHDIASNLDIHINIDGNLNFGFFKSYDDYKYHYDKFQEILKGLDRFKSIKGTYYETGMENGYLGFCDNLDSFDNFKAVYSGTGTLSEDEKYAKEDYFSLEMYGFNGYLDYKENKLVNEIYNAIGKKRKYLVYKYMIDNNYRINRDELDGKMWIFSNMPRIYGTENDSISYIENTFMKISKGRYFTKEEIEQADNVIIMPESSYVISTGDVSRKVAIGDKIPLSIIIDGKEVFTEYYEVIGLHNGYCKYYKGYWGKSLMEIGEVSTLKNDNIVFNSYIPLKRFDNLYNKFNEYKQAKKLRNVLSNDMKAHESDSEYTFVEDHLTISEVVISLKNFDEYYDIISYLESNLKSLNNDNDYLKYVYESNVSDYSNIAGSISSFNTIFKILKYLSIIIAWPVLLIILINEFKKRDKETAIRLSLGENIKNIYRDYFKEYSFLAMIGFIIASIFSFVLSRIIRNSLTAANYYEASTTTIDHSSLNRMLIKEIYSNYIASDSLIVYPVILIIFIILFISAYYVAYKFRKPNTIKELLAKE